MNKYSLGGLSLILLLTACGANNVKEPNPSSVEDKSIPAHKVTPSTPEQPHAGPGADIGVIKKGDIKEKLLTDTDGIPSEHKIYFDFNEVGVKDQYRQIIGAHAKYLVAHPNVNVMLQGNTDERGSREYNLALGQSRAATVKGVMNVYGVPSKQIETSSYGKEMPSCNEQNETCWAKNRRVDIVYGVE